MKSKVASMTKRPTSLPYKNNKSSKTSKESISRLVWGCIKFMISLPSWSMLVNAVKLRSIMDLIKKPRVGSNRMSTPSISTPCCQKVALKTILHLEVSNNFLLSTLDHNLQPENFPCPQIIQKRIP